MTAPIEQNRPAWLKKKITSGSKYLQLHEMIGGKGLHTVCQEACCPNQGECYSSGTSTFMILGDRCTRNCRFCAVRHGNPDPPDVLEPEEVAETIYEMDLKYAVVTSVTRDDLADGGASIFAETISAVREIDPRILLEVLIPDFQGDRNALMKVVDAGPDVLNHNIETVARLYPEVRPQAGYRQSLDLLHFAKKNSSGLLTKSGLMLGLGEQPQEIEQTFVDLHSAGCDILTLGQYLAPSGHHHPVYKYYTPDEFSTWRQKALEIGFGGVVAGPFVRSSYMAFETYEEVIKLPRS